MKWEYKTATMEPKGWLKSKVDSQKTDALLNKLGSQGWELVSVLPLAQNMGYAGKTGSIAFMFKRQVT